jgi:hypothetical protein
MASLFSAVAFVAFLLCLFFGVIHLVWQDIAIFAVCVFAIVISGIINRVSSR